MAARPPGAVLLAVGYGAGLATGLARLTNPVVAIGLLAAIAILTWREWWFPLVPAVVAGCIAGGGARVASAASCAAALPAGELRVQARTIDPGEGTGRIQIVDRGCHGVVLARWPGAARVPAGETVRLTGRWAATERPLHRPDGMLLIGDVVSLGAAPNATEGIRNAIVRATRTLYGPRAPLADALLAGWRGGLDPELRAAFASAGLMHLLAVSGLHVALIAGWVYLLLRIARLPRHPAECLGALVALGYSAFLGWPPAAFRASCLLLLAAACRWRQREVRFGASLAVATLLVLMIEPWSITEPGLWLSVAGVTGVVAAVRWSDRAIGTQWWLRSVSGSFGAVISTAPIAAAVFGQVAMSGVLINVVAMPLLVVLLPILFTSIIFWNVTGVIAHAAAASANGLLALLELIARVGGHAPGSAMPGVTGWPAALPWLGALGAAAWAIHGRTTAPEAVRRLTWSGAVALVLLLGVAVLRPASPGNGNLTLVFVDVGQGDAALIRTPLGHWIEVDAGPSGNGADAGRRVVAPMLARLGARRIDLFVMSHAHRDHVGGGASVLDHTPIDLALDPGELFADSAYEGWLASLAEHHTRWRSVHAGAQWMLDGVTFRVLHPALAWAHQGEDLNEDSIVLELTFGAFRALLTGDAGFVAEANLAGDLRPVSVLKVGHHGSRTATGAAFLAAVRPQAAVVSVGRNHYGHPAPETLARLAEAGIRTWRTDVDGSITVTTDGQAVSVKGSRSSATFDARH